jgi:hypothetical protein
MWMQKLSDGVLGVLTPLGPRYIKPTVLRRVYILWIFRHSRVAIASAEPTATNADRIALRTAALCLALA